MNFGFTEDQDMIRQSARDFVKGESTLERVRALHDDDRGYSAELYARMAGSGWLGAVLPEECGGIGLGVCDLICITEELGKGLLPEPLIPFAVLAGSAVLLSGSESHRQALLPALAAGEKTLTLAAYELAGRFKLHHVATRAEHRSDGFVLYGTKCLVDGAATADKILVTARTAGDTREEEGISLFVVDAKAPGVTITPVSTVDHRRRANVGFENVAVPSTALVGPEGGALSVVEDAMDRAIVALCAEMVGGMEEALRRTVEYAQERSQFGRVIGSFQAVKHKAANMYLALEAARSSMYYAAMALDQELPDARAAVSAAKALCSQYFCQVAKEAIQLHGGIGFTEEHDIHLFYKRAIATNVLYGDPTHHRERYVIEKQLDADPVAEVLSSDAGKPALQK